MSYNNTYQSNSYSQGPSAESGYGYGQVSAPLVSSDEKSPSNRSLPSELPACASRRSELRKRGSGRLRPRSPEKLLLLVLATFFSFFLFFTNKVQRQEQHELQPYGQQQPSTFALSQQDFLSRVGHVRNEIRSLTADVQQIAALHQRAITSSDGLASRQLEDLVSQTQLRNTSIRDQIRSLKQDVERTSDSTRGLKNRQFESLNNDFKSELQGYLQEEQQYRERYREQISRQYRIVNPEATENEVRQATDADWGDEGIFQTAVCKPSLQPPISISPNLLRLFVLFPPETTTSLKI